MDFIFYIKVQQMEMIEVTYNELNLNIINPGVYYFYTQKGFINGGIKIKKGSFSHILCKKIEDVENVRDLNFTELLKDTYDCIINEDLIEYPILEYKSYFIFSAKLHSNPYLHLYKQEESQNNNNKKNEEQQEQENTNKKQENEEEEEEEENSILGIPVSGIIALLCLLCCIYKFCCAKSSD